MKRSANRHSWLCKTAYLQRSETRVSMWGKRRLPFCLIAHRRLTTALLLLLTMTLPGPIVVGGLRAGSRYVVVPLPDVQGEGGGVLSHCVRCWYCRRPRLVDVERCTCGASTRAHPKSSTRCASTKTKFGSHLCKSIPSHGGENAVARGHRGYGPGQSARTVMQSTPEVLQRWGSKMYGLCSRPRG